MSKFKRVQDAEAMPNYFNRFASQSPIEDPYAELESGANARRAQINRETGEMQREQKLAATTDKSWERVTQAETYQQPYFGNITEETSRGMDSIGSSIRRVMSQNEVDNGPKANPADFEFITREESEQYMNLRGASIFNPDYFEMQQLLHEKMDQSGGYSKEYMSREAKIEAHKAAREESRQNDLYGPMLRKRETMSARNPMMLNRGAQGVSRIGEENLVASEFGLPNFKQLLAQEAERKERMDEVREAKAGIKRANHKTSQQRHSEWEKEVNLRSSSYQDQDAAWTDSYLRTLGR